MYNTIFKSTTKIVLALDCKDKKDSFTVLDKCSDRLDAIKVNYPLILIEGLQFITELKKTYNIPVIADFKIADAPVTNNRIVTLLKDAGADAVMIHAIIGTDSIFELKQITEDKLGIIIVTELTHPGGLEFTRSFAEDAARLAVTMRCLGIQAPGTRPEQVSNLRKIVGNEKIIFACGVGAQGGQYHEVIKAGADFAIIGRAIYATLDPRKAIENILLH